MKKIILLLLAVNMLLLADFTRIGDIVTDTKTSLQWEDAFVDKDMAFKWEEAVEYCKNLTLGDYDDWRLPNFNELYSIVDKTKHGPAIYDAFENVFSGNYWSSTSMDGFEYNAWYVYFNNGYGYWFYKYVPMHVRCVRAGEE